MTLSEAIEYTEKVVEEYEHDATIWKITNNTKEVERCKKRAEEHRQLVEWLRELQTYRELANCEVERKKIFISQPMNGLTDSEIRKDRARVIDGLYNIGYSSDEITIIDTLIEEKAPDNVNSGLWYLGKSLELLAGADIVVFAKGWRNARGYKIEFECAKKYGIPYMFWD